MRRLLPVCLTLLLAALALPAVAAASPRQVVSFEARELLSARRDATTVTRLRQAGAVLLGKTQTTQYASFDPPPETRSFSTATPPSSTVAR